MPKVVVSLVTHNESRDVERLLPSVFAQTFRDLRVVAVDNASEDGTRAALAAFEKVTPVPMTVIPSRENLGYTGGHNLGISKALEAGADWVLVLNADVVLDPAFSSGFSRRRLAGPPRFGAFTGKILRAEGAGLSRPRVLDTVGIRMTRSGRHFDVAAGLPDDGRYDRPAEIFGVSGCIALFRTAALADAKISTGFFDDDFFVYREDVDLAWRLRGRGWLPSASPRLSPGTAAGTSPNGGGSCPRSRTCTRSRTAFSSASTTPGPGTSAPRSPGRFSAISSSSAAA